MLKEVALFVAPTFIIGGPFYAGFQFAKAGTLSAGLWGIILGLIGIGAWGYARAQATAEPELEPEEPSIQEMLDKAVAKMQTQKNKGNRQRR